MRIGELSKRSGLSRDTIRFYERAGLITSEPSKSSKNTYRNYPDSLLEELEMIALARNVGFSLADIQLFFAAPEMSAQQEGFISNKIAELEEKLEQTQRLLKLLRLSHAALEQGPVEWRE